MCVPVGVSVGGVGRCVTAMCGSHQPPLLPCVVMYTGELSEQCPQADRGGLADGEGCTSDSAGAAEETAQEQ